MRILIAYTFELPGVGGVPTHLNLLKTEYESRGHSVEYLAPDPTWSKYHLVYAGNSIDKKELEDSVTETVRDIYLGKYPDIPPVILDLEIRRHGLMRAAEHFGVNQYDLIHAQDAFSSIAMAQLQHRDIPLVTTLHGCISAEFLRWHTTGSSEDKYIWAYGYAIDHYGAIGSDATIVPAGWIKKELIESFDVPADHVTVVEHGLDTESFMQQLRSQPDTLLPKDKPVIFNHQRLDPFKGHKFMLNALALLSPEQLPHRAYIAGDGGLREDLEDFTKKLNLQNRVTFLGRRHDIATLLAQSDIVVLPSIAEGVCYSAIEAQMAGKPVVAFQTTGLNEVIVHRETGLLSPIGDFKSMSKDIRKLLRDVSLRERMGTMAQKRAVQKWDHQRMAEQTLQVYQHALARKGEYVPDNVVTASLEISNLNEKLRGLYILYNTDVNIAPVNVSSANSNLEDERGTCDLSMRSRAAEELGHEDLQGMNHVCVRCKVLMDYRGPHALRTRGLSGRTSLITDFLLGGRDAVLLKRNVAVHVFVCSTCGTVEFVNDPQHGF